MTNRICSILVLLAMVIAGSGAVCADNISYIDNGKIKLGINLDLGGSITYLSKAGSDLNLINSDDWGRQIQMGHYAGPKPYEPNGKKPVEYWAHLGWNPIQAGDYYGNRSKVLAYKKSKNSLYVKCIPMHWPLNNVPGECIFECWITLKDNTAQIRSRLVNNRPDKTQYEGGGQEMPAIYTNGPWYRVFTYDGSKPYTGAELTQYPSTHPKDWVATENWAALVDDKDWGLGVYEPKTYPFRGGFIGTPGAGGPDDFPTGYLSPIGDEILDYNIDTSYNYVLILGTLKEIRSYVYKQPRPSEHPNWTFNKDRQSWFYRNAVDAGWPIKGELKIDLSKNSAMIYGPRWCWNAKTNPVIYINAAFSAGQKTMTVFWQRQDSAPDSQKTAQQFPVISDGKYHIYAVKLSDNPEYHGMITRAALIPENEGVPGRWLKLKSVGFFKPR